MAATISQTYKEGDQLTNRLVEETRRYLTTGVVNIVNAFNPYLLVLGGGSFKGQPELVQMMEEFIRNKALKAATVNFKIIKTSLSDNAEVVATAALAQNKIGETS